MTDFEREVIERLIRIETKQKLYPCEEHKKEIREVKNAIYKIRLWLLRTLLFGLGSVTILLIGYIFKN